MTRDRKTDNRKWAVQNGAAGKSRPNTNISETGSKDGLHRGVIDNPDKDVSVEVTVDSR